MNETYQNLADAERTYKYCSIFGPTKGLQGNLACTVLVWNASLHFERFDILFIISSCRILFDWLPDADHATKQCFVWKIQ